MLPLKYLLSCPFNIPYFFGFIVFFALGNLFFFSSLSLLSPAYNPCVSMIFYMYIFPLFPIVCSCSPCITEGTAQAVVLLAFLMFPHHEISTCLLLKTTLPCIPFPTLLKESTQKPKLCLSLKYVRTSKNAFIKKCDAASFCVCVCGGIVLFCFCFLVGFFGCFVDLSNCVLWYRTQLNKKDAAFSFQDSTCRTKLTFTYSVYLCLWLTCSGLDVHIPHQWVQGYYLWRRQVYKGEKGFLFSGWYFDHQWGSFRI